jgi:Xaa-Pro dipeptidase
MISRRSLLRTAGAVPLLAAASGSAVSRAAADEPATVRAPDVTGLQSLTIGAQPISAPEREARIAKVQGLLAERKVGALLVEAGSSLEYFTGISWWRSERTTAAVIPARGPVIVVTPAFEEPSIRETLQVGGEVWPWNEADSPFALLADALRKSGVPRGQVAVESTVRFFILDGIRRVSPHYEFISGDPFVRACRMIKSPAELALLETANHVTLEALRYLYPRVTRGMTASEVDALMQAATTALGGKSESPLVLLNDASAYPHGSHHPQTVHEGSIVLMDCGCTVHGYTSDISRTWVVGEPTARQRKVWNTVKRGQELALEVAKIGVPVGSIDDAVRHYYESEGWGPGYRLPGLPHRTGHGIGLDGHESAFLVHGDATPLQAGMCFSDEPGLYIPGEFGVRLEDCWHMTDAGPRTFTPLAKSLEDPI